MGQTTDQIESHIQDTREDLKSNLQELEAKVKTATDWRQYYRNHSGAMLAFAAGGGVLLAAMLGRAKPSATASSASAPARLREPSTPGTKHEVLETLDTIKSALVGVAATKFKNLLGETVPGFREHLSQAENSRRLRNDEPKVSTPH